MHMPTAPMPGPPHRASSCRPSARSHSVTGDVLPAAQVANSCDTQHQAATCALLRADAGSPATPYRWGSTAVHPSSWTRSAKATTSGVIPGTSEMTITAGPVPRRNTRRVLPAKVNESSA